MLRIFLAVLFASQCATAAESDLVVVQAEIVTMDRSHPSAGAFAVSGGRFLAVGSVEDVVSRVGSDAPTIDLADKVIIPGLVDAHLHVVPSYPEGTRLHSVPLSGLSMGQLVSKLQKQVDARPAGDWIVGRGYEDTLLGGHPHRETLDSISGEHPVYLAHSSGHRAVANSLALELAGVNTGIEDPPGGRFGRDSDGALNGQLLETAMQKVVAAQNLTPSEEEWLAGLETTLNYFASLGLTTVADATPYARAWAYRGYATLREQKRLPVRVVAMLPFELLDEFERDGYVEDDRLSIGPVKLFHGNSLSGRTAWLSEPYVGRPDDYGIPPPMSQDELDEAIWVIDSKGMQAAVHSNGDREIDMVLRAFEKLDDVATRRHRIEHASVMTRDLLYRARDMGIVLALHSYVYEHGDKMEDYGAARWDWMHINRTALAARVVVAGNSDYPVSGASPFLRFQSLMTRRARNGKVYGASQRISIEQALHTYTVGSAKSLFLEDRVGTIAVGNAADFVILDEDPREMPGEDLGRLTPYATWVGGREVYRR